MTLTEQAKVLSRGRNIHRLYKTVENWQLAIDLGLVDDRDSAIKLCFALGLYVNGAKGHTNFNKMVEHINKDNK